MYYKNIGLPVLAWQSDKKWDISSIFRHKIWG